jgi:hypothetical protein
MSAMNRTGVRAVRALAIGLMATLLAGGPVAPKAEAAGCNLCQKWKKLRAKCWPKRLSGGGMVVCEFRFSQIEPGFAAETPADHETVTYTCDELKATRDVSEPEKARVLKKACPSVAGSLVQPTPPPPQKAGRQ